MFMTTKMWRIQLMNESEIASKMISFIEEKERQLQVNKLSVDQSRSDVVKSILDELERVTSDENQ